MMRLAGLALTICLLLGLTVMSGRAQGLPPHAAPTTKVTIASLPQLDTTSHFDAAAATQKYLARVSGAARAKSDTYFEGGYGLQLLDLIYALAIAGLLLGLRISANLRDWLADRIHGRVSQTIAFAAIYVVIVIVATLPLSFYEGYWREHAYGLSNQNILQWLSDLGIGAAVTLAAAAVAVPLLYAIIRQTRENWYWWGAGLATLLLVVQVALFPVFVAPLTNHYTPLPASSLKAQILSLARANDVAVDDVYVVDSSRQSNRISANVSGFLGTTRISLTDTLMRQPPDEILAVLGHEMGHYVMGHMLRQILLMGLVLFLGFAFADWGFRATTSLFGGFWHVRRVDDIAGLPLLAALAAIYFFVMTPLTNTISRTIEHQADIFGLDAVRKPDAFASVMLKLSAYRKLEPGQWEEMIFFDHPSGRTRIADAMRWKQEHINDPDISDSAERP